MTALLMLLLPSALRCVDGGERKPHLVLAALVALVLDVWVAHTTFALLAGWPRKGEWTISQMLERLCADKIDEHWALYYSIALRINSESPSKRHIKAAA